ncbi:hypothetical protein [Ralstonia solanacearum]|uniref:Uncharacterized protein n=2 Tax=Ralstonia solanacearum TaxID=305 RepID=F6G3K5_RALS8|nr:hypothetical protein [Ralstonia solanacearum]AEG69838.1 hypothetical protein RSPO_c02544 [Ralstonia solanacearum Po82]EUJ14141.1 hypothetical protein RSP673_12180 [Ralstonia solanacearum P673]MCL9839691.1 hypothetical protein [Ralstonia solanacearum]MCL9842729.1 hypothetical protein [Ralstonia solanacearum]MCL9849496.1 hypothetical protein [Ralstonia solanacearum]
MHISEPRAIADGNPDNDIGTAEARRDRVPVSVPPSDDDDPATLENRPHR